VYLFPFILLAVPPTNAEAIKEAKKQDMSVDENRKESLQAKRIRLEQETSSRWLWYEFTPYEVGCDDLGGEDLILSCLLYF